MRIAMNVGGDVLSAPVPPAEVAAATRQAEDDGFPAVWTAHVFRGTDSLIAMAVAGALSTRIHLGVSVVPTYPRHPHALAQAAATVQSFCGGRFTLGIGVSHRPVIEAVFGLEYASPAAHMREYLQVLGPLLTEGTVDHQGQFYRVRAALNIPGTSPVSVVVAALGPKMLEVAGALSNGTVTWMTGARGVGEYMAPALSKAAAAAGRPSPRIVVGLPIAVCEDANAGRDAAMTVFARYNTLANYRAQMDREGSGDVADQAIYGTEEVMLARLQQLRDAGATEFWPVPFGVGPNPAASIARTTAFLASLAPEI
jgi:F420-dependent oxidoreductase-like protein